jgi:hypothetical protein
MSQPLPLPPSLPAIKLSARGRARPSALRRPAPAVVSRSRSTAADGQALPPSPTAAARWRALPPTFFQRNPTPSQDLRRRAVPPEPLPIAENASGKLHRADPRCWPLFFRHQPVSARLRSPLPSVSTPTHSPLSPLPPAPINRSSNYPVYRRLQPPDPPVAISSVRRAPNSGHLKHLPRRCALPRDPLDLPYIFPSSIVPLLARSTAVVAGQKLCSPPSMVVCGSHR